MIRSFIVVAIVALSTLLLYAQAPKSARQKATDVEHAEWIGSVLRSVQEIKIGATRAQLAELFATEGGLSSPSQRTYVYRGCPHIKVDVKFAASNHEQELPTDKIVEISRPYLQWTISD